MNDERRAEILAAFQRHSSSFDQAAARRAQTAALAALAPPAGGSCWPSAPDLTPRMVETLKLIAHGYSNREIASQLAIGTETVKSHITKLLTTLAARNRAHAVAIAFRSGLIAGGERSRAA